MTGKREYIARIALTVAVIGVTMVLAGCKPEAPPPVSGQFNATIDTTHQVTMSGFSFVPRTITITPGDTVRWINTDNAIHQLVGEGGIASPPLAVSEVYSHTFDKVGNYSYSCSVHPAETGTVYVR